MRFQVYIHLKSFVPPLDWNIFLKKWGLLQIIVIWFNYILLAD